MEQQLEALRSKYNVEIYEPVEHIQFEDLSNIKEIGKGTAGTVYKAILKNTTKVAVKFVSYDKFFIKEFSTLSILKHKNIISLYGYGFKEKWFYVMEWAPGGTLQSWLDHNENIAFDQALDFIAQLARAINHIHSRKLVYQDLKPENILLFDGNTLKLADFGLARSTESKEEPMGTPEYMPPESQWARISTAQDVYAFGCVLGRIVPKIPNCPEWIEKLRSECLNEKAELRPNMANILDSLDRIC